MKVFLLYNQESENAVSAVLNLKPALAEHGFDVCAKDGADAKPNLLESGYLIMLAEKTSDFNAFESEWRFFLNEIRWKRKPSGGIIILSGSDVDTRRIPFALKDAATYNLTDTEFVEKLTNSAQSPPAPKVPHYEPKPLRTPDKAKEESGCKDAHIFEDEPKKSRIDELKAKLEQKRKEVEAKYSESKSKSDPSDKKFDGITRPEPKPVSNTDDEMKRTSSWTYEQSKGDPFPDYKHTPNQTNKNPNSKTGCGIALFFMIFFGFILLMFLQMLDII